MGRPKTALVITIAIRDVAVTIGSAGWIFLLPFLEINHLLPDAVFIVCRTIFIRRNQVRGMAKTLIGKPLLLN
jgi:hypothetical protein